MSPPPCSTLHASITSRALPIFLPRGISISVMRATVFLPTPAPMPTISCASALESSRVFINAPLPTFTSSRMASAPAAIFFDMMLEAIRGRLSTVAVTSRRADSFLSAGHRFPDCPMMLSPVRFTISKNSSRGISVRRPGMLSSLSTVPPV